MQENLYASTNYVLAVLCMVLSGLLALVAVSYYVEPLEGDLTRMGGYAERDFGPNLPQQKLAGGAGLPTAYDRYYDVVVIGDSFSKHGIWQAYLKQKTGFSFTTLHWDDASLDSVLANPIFKATPPKIVIAELGVRSLPSRFVSPGTDCDLGKAAKPALTEKLAFAETTVAFVKAPRRTESRLDDINLKFALSFLENSALRAALRHDLSKVKAYPLTRTDLFSNHKSDAILLLQTWFDKRTWTQAETAKALCGVMDAQARIQSNGKTLFILLPIPDKGSAYAKYIVNPDFALMQNISLLLAGTPINFPRLDALIEKAIDNGEKDVYLPNDTHFGTRGYQLTAEALMDFLAGYRER